MYWCAIFQLNVSITWFTMCPWPAPWRKLMAGAKLGRPVRQYNERPYSLKFEMTATFISCFATESFHCWLWIICTRRAGHVQCMLQDSWDMSHRVLISHSVFKFVLLLPGRISVYIFFVWIFFHALRCKWLSTLDIKYSFTCYCT